MFLPRHDLSRDKNNKLNEYNVKLLQIRSRLVLHLIYKFYNTFLGRRDLDTNFIWLQENLHVCIHQDINVVCVYLVIVFTNRNVTPNLYITQFKGILLTNILTSVNYKERPWNKNYSNTHKMRIYILKGRHTSKFKLNKTNKGLLYGIIGTTCWCKVCWNHEPTILT